MKSNVAIKDEGRDELRIERGIPIPFFRRKKKYGPLVNEIRVGDSVLFSNRNQAVSFWQAIKKSGGEATYRTVKDGFRVWKVK